MKHKDDALFCFSLFAEVSFNVSVPEVHKALSSLLKVKQPSKVKNKFLMPENGDDDQVLLELSGDKLIMNCYAKAINSHFRNVCLSRFLHVLSGIANISEIKLNSLLEPIEDALMTAQLLGTDGKNASFDCIRLHALSESNSILAIELKRAVTMLEELNSELKIYRRFCAAILDKFPGEGSFVASEQFKRLGVDDELGKNVSQLLNKSR